MFCFLFIGHGQFWREALDSNFIRMDTSGCATKSASLQETEISRPLTFMSLINLYLLLLVHLSVFKNRSTSPLWHRKKKVPRLSPEFVNDDGFVCTRTSNAPVKQNKNGRVALLDTSAAPYIVTECMKEDWRSNLFCCDIMKHYCIGP